MRAAAVASMTAPRRPPSLLLSRPPTLQSSLALPRRRRHPQRPQQPLPWRLAASAAASGSESSSSNNGNNGNDDDDDDDGGVAVVAAAEAAAAAASKAADAAESVVAAAVAAVAGDGSSSSGGGQGSSRSKQPQHDQPPPPQAAHAAAAAAALQQPATPATSSTLLRSPYDRELFALALPALLTMLLDPLMNVVDAAMVGHLGTQQLGAVSLGSLCVSFASFLFSFLLFLTTPRVAAANVRGDTQGVQRQAVTGLWLAGALGVLTAASLYFFAPAIVALLRPPEQAVAAFAVDFIRVRAPGVACALLSFVAAGTFRGLKDTRTPLVAAAVATSANLALNVVLIYGCGLGVVGSGLATTAAQATSCALLLGLLRKKGALPGAVEVLSTPPSFADVWPLLKQGAVLSGRIVITFGVIMTGSALCVRQGAASQAAFEVIRQLWLLTIQLFECLNVATQSMCASLLGAGDRAGAKAVLTRSLVLSSAVAAGAGLLVWTLQAPLLRVFTTDAAVLAAASAVLPLLCLFFPVDAVGSVMDGGFIAAGQPGLLSAIQVGGSVVQAAALFLLAERSGGAASVLAVWSVLKILSVVRCVGGAAVHFGAKGVSAYLDKAGAEGGGGSIGGGGNKAPAPAAG
jgi:putative MATE family efflux protein